jgi:hypothetical protein
VWNAKGSSTASAVSFGTGSDWEALMRQIGEENRFN